MRHLRALGARALRTLMDTMDTRTQWTLVLHGHGAYVLCKIAEGRRPVHA